MNKPTIFWAAAVIAALAAGFAGGIVLQKTKYVRLSKDLSSKAVISIALAGKVVSVDGNMLTISDDDKNDVSIYFKGGAKVDSFLLSDDGIADKKTFNVKDLKKDAFVNISAKLLPEGIIEAQSVSLILTPAK